MEIKLDLHLDPVSSRPASSGKPGTARPEIDRAQFDQSAELNQALAASPEVRSDAVDRGQRLIGDVAYPPPETIRSLATLLAMHLDKDMP